MAEEQAQAAVLFADVSGSTKLYETAGDQVAKAAIDQCIRIMRDCTDAAKGRVIKTIGDEVMSTFPSADAAADAAIEMQSAISELKPVGNSKIGIRVGFNWGPIVNQEDGDIFGDAVNVASRLSHVAVKGQIITARDTVMLMSPMLKSATRKITNIQIKGKAAEVEVY
jgi:adenylate cyclase